MNLKKDVNRQIEFDFLRILAIILVFLSHYLTTGSNIGLNNFVLFLGILGNGTFFFISGYLIYLHNKDISTVTAIKDFYRKRILRIYPLYWLAILLFLLSMFIQNQSISLSIFEIFITFLGLQMVFYPQYVSNLVLWFIGIIVVYYAIYPFLMYAHPITISRLLLYSALLIIPLVMLKFFFGLFGGGIFEYYFIFIFGIIASEIKLFDNQLFKKYWSLLFILFGLLFAYALVNYQAIGSFEKLSNLSLQIIITIFGVIGLRIVIIVSFVLLIVGIFSNYFPKTKCLSRAILIGALGSYALYLFQMLPYPVVALIIHPQTNPILFNISAICIVLPVMVIICYYIQVFSDKFLLKF